MRIELRNEQVVYDLTPEQRKRVAKVLTFDNPAYKNAKKYGRSRYISIPATLEYYDEFSYSARGGERKKGLRVPMGVDLYSVLSITGEDLSLEKCVEDYRVEHTVRYPEFKLTLRADQEMAMYAYLSETDKMYGEKGIIQLPTGKGKTILALYLASVLKQKTLILVHKDDLVVGWQKDIALCFPDIRDVGLIKAKSRRIGRQLTIATVQTLNRMGEDELKQYTEEFGMVIMDECHHCPATTFSIIGKFHSRYKLGLSATPKRSDGLTHVLNVYLGGVCYAPPVREEDDDISQVEVRYINSLFRYEPFYFNGQVFNYYDFKPEDIPEPAYMLVEMGDSRPRIPFLEIDKMAVGSDLTKIQVCDALLKEYLDGHSCLVLFTQKEHVRQYYDYLKDRVLDDDHLMCYYGDSTESSEDMMARAESGKVKITLATYAKATEGTNVKAWEVLFMVSSSNNEKNIEQATGRIRRRKEGKLDPVRVYVVRYPNCYSLRSHKITYERVFKRLKYIVPEDDKRSKRLFTRGYR